jgi:hypothetical protein
MHHIGHERKQIQDITMPVVHELKQSLYWEMFKNLESMLKIKETFTFSLTNLHIGGMGSIVYIVFRVASCTYHSPPAFFLW